jgi:hypothetical protein
VGSRSPTKPQPRLIGGTSRQARATAEPGGASAVGGSRVGAREIHSRSPRKRARVYAAPRRRQGRRLRLGRQFVRRHARAHRYPDHQLGINRGSAHLAVEGFKLVTKIGQYLRYGRTPSARPQHAVVVGSGMKRGQRTPGWVPVKKLN